MGLPRIASYPLPTPTEFPAARAPWRPDPSRAALLIHDMQAYFVGAFPQTEAPISPVVRNIHSLAAHCRRRGMPVFYTAQPGDQDRRDRGLQADLWGPGMSWAADQQAIVPALAPEPDDHVLTKWRYSAFQRSTLGPMLQARDRDQLIVCGVFAHIGCLLTAADAFMRDIEPFFVVDAVADFSRDHHDRAVAYVAACCGVPIMTASLIEAL